MLRHRYAEKEHKQLAKLCDQRDLLQQRLSKRSHDQVEAGESIITRKEPEAGTSSSISSNFKGSCPLCDRVFECLPELEAHVNVCEGQSGGQVKAAGKSGQVKK